MLAIPWSLWLAFGATAAHADRDRCGPNNCSEGTKCCNYGCGICTAPGGACIMPFCYWGRPEWIDAENWPGFDVFDRVRASASLSDLRIAPPSADASSVTGASLRLGWQYYAFEKTALRLRLSGTRTGESPLVPGSDAVGYTVGAGATYALPIPRKLRRFVLWGLVVDGQWRDGLDLANDVLAIPGDGRVATTSVGLAFADQMNVVPTTLFVRYVQAFGDSEAGLLDAGVGVSVDFGVIQLPLGARLGYRYTHEATDGGYRAHELSGGVYVFKRDEVRIGVDGRASFARLPMATEARVLSATVRLDWYWDANY